MAQFKFDDLFVLRENLVNISARALLIPEFRALYRRDTSARKERSGKEFGYVYYMEFFRSEYNSYGDDKEKVIIEDMFGDKNWKPDDKVMEARFRFRELQKTLSIENLLSARKAVQALNKYYNALSDKPEDIDPTKIVNALGKSGELYDALERLEDRVMRELGDKSSGVHGGGKLGIFEDPEMEEFAKKKRRREIEE
jgi:hypothetical protein